MNKKPKEKITTDTRRWAFELLEPLISKAVSAQVEKEDRIRYQDIVVELCNIVDRERGVGVVDSKCNTGNVIERLKEQLKKLHDAAKPEIVSCFLCEMKANIIAGVLPDGWLQANFKGGEKITFVCNMCRQRIADLK